VIPFDTRMKASANNLGYVGPGHLGDSRPDASRQGMEDACLSLEPARHRVVDAARVRADVFDDPVGRISVRCWLDHLSGQLPSRRHAGNSGGEESLAGDLLGDAGTVEQRRDSTVPEGETRTGDHREVDVLGFGHDTRVQE
jgi:hypothetical protein